MCPCISFLHGAISMVRKEFLPIEQKMDAATFVDQAREMAASLEDQEAIAIKSRQLARLRVARIAGISAALLHSLRYRPPKTIAADAFERLCIAVERQAASQIRKAQHEIASARARRLGVDDCALREVEAALDKARALLKGGPPLKRSAPE